MKIKYIKDKDGTYTGIVIDKPGVISCGKTIRELNKSLIRCYNAMCEYEKFKETFRI